MTFQPVIPLGGFSGWAFLKRTMPSQQAAANATPANKRDEAYFRAKIGSVRTADDLMADRRLLSVALTAYGLEGDINNKAFIRKVLADGTLKADALSNRLADKQYQKFSAAFGFGDFSVPRTQLSDFADKLLAQFRTRKFETAVGEQNNSFRLAMNAEREVQALAARPINEDTKWFTILGNAPMRDVFRTALGLPSSFSSIDLDQQVTVLKERTRAQFGEGGISQFASPDKVSELVRKYLVRSELAANTTSFGSTSIALQLLQRR